MRKRVSARIRQGSGFEIRVLFHSHKKEQPLMNNLDHLHKIRKITTKTNLPVSQIMNGAVAGETRDLSEELNG